MADKLNVITGATGLLGSHIAEKLVAAGERVRALVRPTSDVTFLRQLGVELVQGDLKDVDSLRRCIEGADIVYHAAARVGDWGPWRAYQEEVIEGTQKIFDVCRTCKVGRVLYVGSITVFGHPRGDGAPITEEAPLGQNLYWFWDYYCRSKILAEQIARSYGPDVTIVRPSWMYGPRDRLTLPRLLAALRAGRVTLIGTGENLLNLIYAGDVAEGAILAANQPVARGEAYNLSSEGELTQRNFLNAATDLLGKPRIQRHMPFWLAYAGGFISEVIGRAIFLRRPPHITRYVVGLVGRPTRFSIAKARDHLGWQPRVNAHEGLERTLEWLRSQQASPSVAASVKNQGKS